MSFSSRIVYSRGSPCGYPGGVRPPWLLAMRLPWPLVATLTPCLPQSLVPLALPYYSLYPHPPGTPLSYADQCVLLCRWSSFAAESTSAVTLVAVSQVFRLTISESSGGQTRYCQDQREIR